MNKGWVPLQVRKICYAHVFDLQLSFETLRNFRPLSYFEGRVAKIVECDSRILMLRKQEKAFTLSWINFLKVRFNAMDFLRSSEIKIPNFELGFKFCQCFVQKAIYKIFGRFF